jgi:AraC-like DNA-binding protein
LRQVERRIKSQSGRSIREWQSLIRTEALFFTSREKFESGESINLAELALDEGFSDQAHLSRATKRVTGFSPTEFAQRYLEDESFWLYRLWV